MQRLISEACVLDGFITCAICMSDMSGCRMTQCGHRFCTTCIQESMSTTNLKCPCCNAPIRRDQLIRDHQFDALIDAIHSAKRSAESERMMHLLTRSVEGDDRPESSASGFYSPIESVLRDHMKRSLTLHESYYQDLRRQCDKEKKRLDVVLEQHVQSISSSNLSGAELMERIRAIRDSHGEKKNHLEEEFSQNARYIASAYDKYLNEHIPTLFVIPLNVTIHILCKNVSLDNVVLEPHDKVQNIMAAAEKAAAEKAAADNAHGPIVQWGDDVRIFAFGPFMKYDTVEMSKVIATVLNGLHVDNVAVLPPDTPLLHLNLKQGTIIVVYGAVMFESDIPKKCFATTFDAVNPGSIDYFSCQTCKTSWICKPCMGVCHREHNVTPYIINHHPQWACCYCEKTKNCVLRQHLPRSEEVCAASEH